MKNILLIGALLALSGCSVIFPKAAPELSKAVNKYCTTLSQEERALLRAQVNAAIQPNQACVYCDGDAGTRCLTTAP
jgi:uncharacterized protein YceK